MTQSAVQYDKEQFRDSRKNQLFFNKLYDIIGANHHLTAQTGQKERKWQKKVYQNDKLRRARRVCVAVICD
jgi:hypothetical protein